MSERNISVGGFDLTKGTQTLAYTRKWSLIEYFRTYRPHGLEFNVAWLWMHLEDVETKEEIFICREYKVANSNFMLVNQKADNLDKDGERLYTEPGTVFLGYTTFTIDEEEKEIYVRPRYPGAAAFDLLIRPQYLKYLDCGGDVDVECTAIAPGYIMYLPGEFGIEDDIMYGSEHYDIAGTFKARKVKGWGGLDISWNPPGVDYRDNKLHQGIEALWASWFNEYSDGTFEGGVIINGLGEHHMYYHYDHTGASKVYKTHNNKYKMNGDLLLSASFEFDGNKFEYATEARGVQSVVFAADHSNVIEEEKDEIDWVVGKVINLKNKDKKIVRYYCINEYQPSRVASLEGVEQV